MSNIKLNKIKDAKDTFQSLMEISTLLGGDLDAETLSICVRMIEAGVNPSVLASVVKTMQKEMEALNKGSSSKQN